jgi:hypothetical protein
MSPDVSMAVASLSSGLILSGPDQPEGLEQLQDLAATVPEIFGTLELGCLSRIAERLAIETDGDELIELVLLSGSRVQVVHSLSQSPELALVAVSHAVGKVGLVLSQVHTRVSARQERR